jgi:hypothetical protein
LFNVVRGDVLDGCFSVNVYDSAGKLIEKEREEERTSINDFEELERKLSKKASEVKQRVLDSLGK